MNNNEQLKKEIQEKVFQSLGQASMCWTETPKGIFKSEEAKQIGDKLVSFLETKLRQAYQAGLEEAVTTIGSDMGWEESEDHYREILGLPLKYKK